MRSVGRSVGRCAGGGGGRGRTLNTGVRDGVGVEFVEREGVAVKRREQSFFELTAFVSNLDGRLTSALDRTDFSVLNTERQRPEQHLNAVPVLEKNASGCGSFFLFNLGRPSPNPHNERHTVSDTVSTRTTPPTHCHVGPLCDLADILNVDHYVTERRSELPCGSVRGLSRKLS